MLNYLQVTSLCTGRLTEDERDVLLIGTVTHVLAYQVEDNADLFYKEVSVTLNFASKMVCYESNHFYYP